MHVPVARRLTGQARLDYIARCMELTAPEVYDDPRFEPNSAYWDKQVKLEHAYRLHSFFAPEPPAEWLADSDDDVTNTSDEDFAASMERERVRYEAVERAHCTRAGRVQPPPPQPQQATEEVDGDDDGLGDWPPTPEWDPGHMQLAIAADIAATATGSAVTTSSSAATTSPPATSTTSARDAAGVLCSPLQGPAPAPTAGARRATLLTRFSSGLDLKLN